MRFILMLCSLLLFGCSNRTTYTVEPVASEKFSLEALGYDAQLASELNAVRTDFQIPYPEAAYAFERGRLFFNRFGGGTVLSMRGKSESVLTARNQIKDYKYILTRRDSAGGAWFYINCQRFNSQMNEYEHDQQGYRCKNFARFVNTGTIEDKLVTAIMSEE